VIRAKSLPMGLYSDIADVLFSSQRRNSWTHLDLITRQANVLATAAGG